MYYLMKVSHSRLKLFKSDFAPFAWSLQPSILVSVIVELMFCDWYRSSAFHKKPFLQFFLSCKNLKYYEGRSLRYNVVDNFLDSIVRITYLQYAVSSDLISTWYTSTNFGSNRSFLIGGLTVLTCLRWVSYFLRAPLLYKFLSGYQYVPISLWSRSV